MKIDPPNEGEKVKLPDPDFKTCLLMAKNGMYPPRGVLMRLLEIGYTLELSNDSNTPSKDELTDPIHSELASLRKSNEELKAALEWMFKNSNNFIRTSIMLGGGRYDVFNNEHYIIGSAKSPLSAITSAMAQEKEKA